MVNFLDTSAILNGGLADFKYEDVCISPLSLIELENIKTSKAKDESVKAKARAAVRGLIYDRIPLTTNFSKKDREKVFHKFPFLLDITDHHILAEAYLLSKEHEVCFITSDGAQFIISRRLPIAQQRFYEPVKKDISYTGWRDFTPTEEQLASLYSEPTNNILNCSLNEFAKIFVGQELKDVLFWNGEEYRKIKYKEFTSTLGEKVKPRNLEQKMYLDLLQNKDIPVKLCIAKFGTGKSWLALSYALREVQSGRFDKIVFVKNNLEVTGAGHLGTLPGDEFSKQMPWLRQIEDHVGIQEFETLIESGRIEPAHLSTLRGRDLKNCCILVDEAENLLDTNIQLLLGRVASGSEIIFCADVKQCDYQNKMQSGIPKMIQSLYGHKNFGMVKLLKTERSEVAAMADLMD